MRIGKFGIQRQRALIIRPSLVEAAKRPHRRAKS